MSESTAIIALMLLVFFFGFMLGSRMKMLLFQSQEWMILRWDKDIFGFRVAREGSTLLKNDRVIMALEFDTSTFPEEGIKVNEKNEI